MIFRGFYVILTLIIISEFLAKIELFYIFEIFNKMKCLVSEIGTVIEVTD